MEKLDLEIISQTLKDIFQVEKIRNLGFFSKPTVNSLLSFQIADRHYIMKVLTREPTRDAEFYRFEKEAELLRFFAREATRKGAPVEQILSVPVPEVIHLESNVGFVGFKFEILAFVPGITLDEGWKRIPSSQKERLTKQIARIVRGIHSVTYDMFGDIEDFACPRRFYSFSSMLKANLRRDVRVLGIRGRLPLTLLAEAQQFVEDNLEKATNFLGEPTLVHSDLNLTNFLVAEDEFGDWQVRALFDFEWAYAGNSLADLFGVEKDLFSEPSFQKLFFEEYSDGKLVDLEAYPLERKLLKIVAALGSAAYGWVHFHPTKENLERIITTIRRALD